MKLSTQFIALSELRKVEKNNTIFVSAKVQGCPRVICGAVEILSPLV
jgi:hypothetical protein